MYYVGIDLHSDNSYIAVKDEVGKPIFNKRLKNNLDNILMTLNQWPDISRIVVESTFNWYWLVDGLQNNGYNVLLANTSQMNQYDGLKYTNDKSDAFKLAEVLRLNTLPTGYIYPKKLRPLRDLFRRRMSFVKQKTSNIINFQGLIAKCNKKKISSEDIRKLTENDLCLLFNSEIEIFNAFELLKTIHFLTKQVKEIERKVAKELSSVSHYKKLMTVDGIGKILAATIYLETGDIKRFKTVGNYSSYCRVVNSTKTSNNKKKGKGNKKNGNKYLAWAFGEAAVCAKQYSQEAKNFFLKKEKKVNSSVAYRALAHKLARVCYWIMRDDSTYDSKRIFSGG